MAFHSGGSAARQGIPFMFVWFFLARQNMQKYVQDGPPWPMSCIKPFMSPLMLSTSRRGCTPVGPAAFLCLRRAACSVSVSRHVAHDCENAHPAWRSQWPTLSMREVFVGPKWKRPIVAGSRPIVAGRRPMVAGSRPMVVGGRPMVAGGRPMAVGGRPMVAAGGRPLVVSGAPMVAGWWAGWLLVTVAVGGRPEVMPWRPGHEAWYQWQPSQEAQCQCGTVVRPMVAGGRQWLLLQH